MKSVCNNFFCYVWLLLLCFCGLAGAKPLLTFSSIGNAVDSNSRWISGSSVELFGCGPGFSDTGDNVIFAWGTASGNFDAAIHVGYITDTSSNSETGLMVRVDTTEGVPFCALVILQEECIAFRYRTGVNGAVSTIVLSNNIHEWLRIRRAGNNIKLLTKATSGAAWQNIGSYQLQYPSALLIGAVHTSHSDSVNSSAVIDNFTGFIEESQRPSSCIPVLYDFEDTVSLVSEGFRSILNWEKDTAGFIKTVLPSSLPVCSAYIKTPQFLTQIGNENVTVSWNLNCIGDSMPYLYDYGIFSLQQMQLGDRTKISGSRIGSAAGIDIGINDTLSTTIITVGSTVHRERSRVIGNVKVTGACSLMVGATVTGTITQGASIIPPAIPVRTVSPGIDSVIVNPNDSVNLLPGQYRTFHAYANAKVRFSAGVYHFRTFITEPEVKIYCSVNKSSRIDVNIAQNFQLADRTVMKLTDTTAWSNVTFYSNQDSTMNMGADLVLMGYFFLPNAQTRIVSRSCMIKGGLYTKKLKCEPDVSLFINNTANSSNNELEMCLVNENSSQLQQKLKYTIHRSDYSDSCKDFLFRSGSDTLFSYAANEKTPIGRDLHFEFKIYPTGKTGLLYNNGLYLRQIFDSIPFALSNLTALTFRYLRNDATMPVTLHLDSILISCSQDTCSPIILIRNPVDTTVYIHSTVVFSCEVKSRGAVPVYQWYRDGVAVPWANQATYSIAHTSLSDNGAAFSCRISNGCSEARTNTVVLTVWDCTEPRISDQPDDDTVMLGHPAAFSVTAQNGLVLKYQWLRNNTVIENANGSDYTITTTHAYNNFDEYRVKVTTDCGSWKISEPAKLVITDINPCKILQQPRGDTLMEGETFQTEIQVVCPNSVYTWYKNSALLAGYLTNRCIYGPVTLADNNAQFYCIVDNGVTSDTSGVALLRVKALNDTRQSVAITGELYNGKGNQMGKNDPELYDFKTMLFTRKTGGSPLYTETHKGVTVKEGTFTIVLGHGNADKDLQSSTAAHKELYAEIYAGKNNTFEQVAPRLRLTAAPYAFTSGLKVVHGYGNPDSTAATVPLGTMYVDEADSNRTWKLGSKGWARLE
jgi:hypothetical protein